MKSSLTPASRYWLTKADVVRLAKIALVLAGSPYHTQETAQMLRVLRRFNHTVKSSAAAKLYAEAVTRLHDTNEVNRRREEEG